MSVVFCLRFLDLGVSLPDNNLETMNLKRSQHINFNFNENSLKI